MATKLITYGAGFTLFNAVVSAIPAGDELDNMNDDSINKLGEVRHNVVQFAW